MSMQATAVGMLRPTLTDAAGNDVITWPEVAAFLVLVILAGILISTGLDIWKTKRLVGKEAELRELVNRYEQLASNTMDAQQRTATDVAELRSRASSIEQILRSVE